MKSHYVAMAEMQINTLNNRQHSTRDWLSPIPGTGEVQEHELDVLVTFRSMTGTTIMCRYDRRTGRWTISG